MAYQPLPWLNIGPDAFLAALDRGTQAGLENARLALAAERPRGGGGGFIRRSSFDPLEQARADAILSETALKEGAAADRSAAKAENERLMSIGVSPEEAAAQSGFAEYMRPSSGSRGMPPNPFRTYNLGGGEIGRVDESTGEYTEIKAPRQPADRTGNPWQTFRTKDGKFIQINRETGEERPVGQAVTEPEAPKRDWSFMNPSTWPMFRSDPAESQAVANLMLNSQMAPFMPGGTTLPWGAMETTPLQPQSGFRILSVTP